MVFKRTFSFSKAYPEVAVTIATIIVALAAWALHFGQVTRWLLILFSLAMAAKLAWGMVQTLREGRWGIDILAVMAIVSTVAVNEYWASIVIVLMLTGGEALEDYAAGRAQRELTALMKRAPQIAHRIGKNDKVTDVALEKVAVNDLLLLRPGEVVPVDAVIAEGASSFDESSLTGESLPVDRKKSDELLSGAVNGEASVTIRALHTAHDSQYEQIIELVKAAADSEAPFVRLADRYAVPFTLISFAIAGVAWFLAGNPLRFAEVLVVATPCPLLLGAPIALISGMSRAAKHGIIVKNGATLEKMARIKTMAFDKTGTLTIGEPKVSKVHPAEGFDEKTVLGLAASAEQDSAHVLARAVVDEAKRRKARLQKATNVRETTASGVCAKVNKQMILVGKADFLRSKRIDLPKNDNDSGETAVYVAQDKTFVGTIHFADKVRSNSAEALRSLRNLGVQHTLMLTGDAKATAQRIAKQLGITDVKAECLPKDKLKAIHAIPKDQRLVAMVGDGINDAPVLAAADVGIAMGARGSTAASESADVIIMLDDISRSALAVKVAKHTIRIALQSIIVGIVISIGLMLVASTGKIPAVLGAGLQEVVDVVVIFNALRAHGSFKRNTGAAQKAAPEAIR